MVDHPSRLARLIERSAPIGQLFQNVAIIFGVIATAATFLSGVHDKRVQTVLALRNEFANHTHDDYLKLMNDWDSAPEADTVSKAVETEHKEIQKKFFLKQVNRERLRSVVDFFDTLSACVEQGSCDRNTAVYLFGSAANQVFNISAFHVEDTRTDENPDFGRGLENIYRLEPENFLLSYL